MRPGDIIVWIEGSSQMFLIPNLVKEGYDKDLLKTDQVAKESSQLTDGGGFLDFFWEQELLSLDYKTMH